MAQVILVSGLAGLDRGQVQVIAEVLAEAGQPVLWAGAAAAHLELRYESRILCFGIYAATSALKRELSNTCA